MLFDPTERNVNPILFPARVRPMKELILALTGLTPPPEVQSYQDSLKQ